MLARRGGRQLVVLRRPRPRRVRARAAADGLWVPRPGGRPRGGAGRARPRPRRADPGSSMGAATAMAFALAHPGRVEALVQITPAYDGCPARTILAETGTRWPTALERGDIDAFVRAVGRRRAAGALPRGGRLATRQRLERHDHPDAVADALREVPRSAAFDGLERLEEARGAGPGGGQPRRRRPRATRWRSPRSTRAGCRARRWWSRSEGESPLAWQGAQLSRAIAGFLDQL